MKGDIFISDEKELRGRYRVLINKQKMINYNELFYRFINKCLLKEKDNIVCEQRNKYKSKHESKTEEDQYESSNDIKMLSN